MRSWLGVMFFRRKPKTRPRVFLGNIAVVPRRDIKRVIEGLLEPDEDGQDQYLNGALREIFALPQAASADPLLDTDLGIDLFIPGYHTGQADCLDLGIWGVALLWRPKIQLQARLYQLRDRKTVRMFAVTERASLREYVARALSRIVTITDGPLFGRGDMEILLNRASLRLLEKIVKVAYA